MNISINEQAANAVKEGHARKYDPDKEKPTEETVWDATRDQIIRPLGVRAFEWVEESIDPSGQKFFRCTPVKGDE